LLGSSSATFATQAGLGAALAFVLFVIIAIFTIFQRRLVGKTVQQ
jgi:ABC-type sugar transport system permease subunit